jgi:hypothetical protein
LNKLLQRHGVERVASNDLLGVILGEDPSELNPARARVLVSKGKGYINVAAYVEKEVMGVPQSAISFDAQTWQ